MEVLSCAHPRLFYFQYLRFRQLHYVQLFRGFIIDICILEVIINVRHYLSHIILVSDLLDHDSVWLSSCSVNIAYVIVFFIPLFYSTCYTLIVILGLFACATAWSAIY